MYNPEINALDLFIDGLTLIYHEARHVRFLIEKGYVTPVGWERIVSLPRNRVEAWRKLHPLREAAKKTATAASAAALFEIKLGRNIKQLAELYENQHWKHATSCGGHKWQDVTSIVRDLRIAIEVRDASSIDKACFDLVRSHHNNGRICEKLLELDEAIKVKSNPLWNSQS